MNADAKAIAASIDTSTVDGHNLGSVILISAFDRYPWATCPDVDGLLDRCVGLGLMFEGGGLTQLGREVAELLRPQQYRAEYERNSMTWRVTMMPGDICSYCTEAGAQRIAALLNADNMREAMEYRST